MREFLYVSWGGAGRGTAIRAAVEEARAAEAQLSFLAVLDEAFEDVDEASISLVSEELAWLIRAQLNLVCRELQAEDTTVRIVVRRGPLMEVIPEVVRELSVQAVLLGAPVPLDTGVIALLEERVAIPVRTVGPSY